MEVFTLDAAREVKLNSRLKLKGMEMLILFCLKRELRLSVSAVLQWTRMHCAECSVSLGKVEKVGFKAHLQQVMACVLGLKRPLEFDPVHSPESRNGPKRRRLLPHASQAAAPYRRVTPHNCSVSHAPKESPFSTPSLNPDTIAQSLRDEYRRLRRRDREGSPFQSSSTMEASSPPHSPPSLGGGPSALPYAQALLNAARSTVSPPPHQGASTNPKDKPIFTLKQVTLICEKLLREREAQIREEYDEVLNTKLAEQYAAFVRFTHDQIQRRFAEDAATPSYMS